MTTDSPAEPFDKLAVDGHSGPLVVAREASRTFATGQQAIVAVHGASCAISPDARIALSGPSGSGKSTLLHLFAGLDRPSSGTLEWPAFRHDGVPKPSDVATVFQGASLIPSLNVRENVGLPLVLLGARHGEAAEHADEVLTKLGIDDLGDALPQELSGGQAQRVAVARAVAPSPRLILADEPTGQLDHVAAGKVIDVLIEVADQVGAALVVSTHDPLVASRLSTRWVMHAGRLQTSISAPEGARS